MTRKNFEVIAKILAMKKFTIEQKQQINYMLWKTEPSFDSDWFWKKVEENKNK